MYIVQVEYTHTHIENIIAEYTDKGICAKIHTQRYMIHKYHNIIHNYS